MMNANATDLGLTQAGRPSLLDRAMTTVRSIAFLGGTTAVRARSVDADAATPRERPAADGHTRHAAESPNRWTRLA
jgi:hypothetical protein